MTTLEGKSAFPENHPLSLGTGGGGVMSGPVYQFLPKADLIFGIGCSFTRHGMATNLPPAKATIIHATNDERDLNKNYQADHPIRRGFRNFRDPNAYPADPRQHCRKSFRFCASPGFRFPL